MNQTDASKRRPTVVITGAASGIGAQTARLLAAQGASIIALDRVAPDFPVQHFVPVDLMHAESIDTAVAETPAGIDALCNVAGVPGTLGADRVARVNYLGLRYLTEQLVPKITRDGAIVNVASTAGQGWPQKLPQHLELARVNGFQQGLDWIVRNPVSDALAYPYFKEALIVWTMHRAATLRSRTGIRMNCVSPGPTDTPILNDFRVSLGHASVDDAIRRAGGVGRPEDIAPVIAFLTAPASAWIVGANLMADGGLVASRLLDMEVAVQPAAGK
ncbi:3-alpha-hydroxysteroid dehydrogenase [Cupriavidus necator]|uniref:coniferyl-alcohol dehydrogenase n=1 Tax=Cupriavidus necator TaxID=106590 RepID=UPI003F7398F2